MHHIFHSIRLLWLLIIRFPITIILHTSLESAWRCPSERVNLLEWDERHVYVHSDQSRGAICTGLLSVGAVIGWHVLRGSTRLDGRPAGAVYYVYIASPSRPFRDSRWENSGVLRWQRASSTGFRRWSLLLGIVHGSPHRGDDEETLPTDRGIILVGE